MAARSAYHASSDYLYSHKTTEGASTLLIAQVKGLKNTCQYCLFV